MSDYTTTTVSGVPHPEIIKDPDAVLDYTIDWAAWLDDISDTITSHTVTAATGLTCSTSTVVGKTVIMWLSGGTAGTTYQVTCRVVTTGGRTEDQTIFVKCVSR